MLKIGQGSAGFPKSISQVFVQFIKALVILRQPNEVKLVFPAKLNAHDGLDVVLQAAFHERKYAGGIIDIGEGELPQANFFSFRDQVFHREGAIFETVVAVAIEEHKKQFYLANILNILAFCWLLLLILLHFKLKSTTFAVIDMQQITLFELNKIIKQTLDKNLEPSYWLVAEIGEMRTNQKGHCYLDLVEKEDNKIIAKSRASIWAYNYRTISSWFERVAGQPLKNGMKILANVVVSFHEVYGFCLVIRDIDPNFTLGERARKRQEVIDRLQDDGVFTMNKTLQLPLVPQRIAVVSSASAAGYGDFMDQLSHNQYGYHFEVKLFQAVMQGDQAVESILNALITIFNQSDKYDLVAIIRGGGAQVDLDCFDTYDLAAHVAQFPLPILTGIGHDRDETITDLVAHTKLKTPTAVAEFMISGLRVFEDKLEQLFERLHAEVRGRLEDAEHQLFRLGGELRHVVSKKLNRQQNKVESLQHHLQNSSRAHLKFSNEKLTYWQKNLELLDPTRIFKRGYSLTVKKDGKTIGKGTELQSGDEITTFTEHYRIASTITKIDKNEQ